MVSELLDKVKVIKYLEIIKKHPEVILEIIYSSSIATR